MSRFSVLVSTLSLGVALLLPFGLVLLFQNCAGYEADFNPLFDRESSLGCMGDTCIDDLTTSEIRIANEQPIGLTKPASGAALNFCDNSTCLDVAGYCTTGGYERSAFYYQWYYNSLPVGEVKSTGSSCHNGRFRILVEIPRPNEHAYNHDNIYQVQVSMRMVDDNGVERGNPSGITTKFVNVK